MSLSVAKQEFFDGHIIYIIKAGRNINLLAQKNCGTTTTASSIYCRKKEERNDSE